jgi:hypothetical protein
MGSLGHWEPWCTQGLTTPPLLGVVPGVYYVHFSCNTSLILILYLDHTEVIENLHPHDIRAGILCDYYVVNHSRLLVTCYKRQSLICKVVEWFCLHPSLSVHGSRHRHHTFP